MIKHMVAAMAAAVALALSAQEAEKAAPPLNWDAAPVDIVLQAYAESIDKIVLKDPGVPNATISLKARDGQQLTLEEYLEAIEVVLEMNGVHIEPYGEKFIRAIPRNKARKEGIPLILDPDTELRDSGKVVSMMIPFKNIAVAEAQKLLEGLKSDTGILLVFERTNAILVTDTEQNINRMIEIAKTVDVASPVLENVFVRQIKYASVSDVKTILENIVKESQAAQEKENGKGAATPAAQNADRSADRRLLGRRPAANNAPEAQPAANVNESVVMSVSDADRGMIRGKVIMMSDERSNKLIVITQKANMDFFDKIIEQMDVETTPDVKVEVIRLKYADAEEVSDMINDLIGNASGNKNSSKNNTNQNAQKGTSANVTSGTTRPANTRTAGAAGESKAGELSKDNVVVLADKRINGLVIMARTQDIPVLHQIIESMDVKLSQVLIETVIIEVGLSDTIKTGIDWVYQIENQRQSLMGGGGSSDAVSGTLGAIANDGASAAGVGAVPSGLHYMGLSKKLNFGAVVSAAKTDSRTKYLASPIIMTVDNKEATIEATQMRYMLTGFTSSGTSYSTIAVPNYEQKQIGITIKTTPKINPNGTVMLTVEEEYSQLGNSQTIQTAGGMSGTSGDSKGLINVNVDTTVTRKMSADISLEDGQSVVIGGLTETTIEKKENGIPLLKDIPWVGRYLFGSTEDEEHRKELLVFMTPYVLKDGDEAEAEAARRKSSLGDARPWEDHGWSKSKLADPVGNKEQLRRQQDEWEREDEEHANELALEKARMDRVVELEKKALDEQKMTIDEAQERIDKLNKLEEEKAALRGEADLVERESNDLLKLLQEEAAAE
ncbi:MAG: hypothetical protein IKO64_05275 [Kiritimatiellae bacterium]|nr:hypothetical protein [Kiritimatiellia bacterium]